MRRYGQVTIKGWIEEDRDLGWCKVWDHPTSTSRLISENRCLDHGQVKYLPEPLQFKDGDMLKHREPSLWLRYEGRWYAGGPDSESPVHDDAQATAWLRSNLAVRLVPDDRLT